MMIRVFQYPRCSTCVKALRWLDASAIPYNSIHIVEHPPSKALLKRLWKRSGLPVKRFFNTSGKSYRDGGYSEKLRLMTDDQALAALAGDGMLIKRPLVDTGNATLVGFKVDEWNASLT